MQKTLVNKRLPPDLLPEFEAFVWTSFNRGRTSYFFFQQKPQISGGRVTSILDTPTDGCELIS